MPMSVNRTTKIPTYLRLRCSHFYYEYYFVDIVDIIKQVGTVLTGDSLTIDVVNLLDPLQ